MGRYFCNFLFFVCHSLGCVAQKTLEFEPVHIFFIPLVSHATESYHKGIEERISDNKSTISYLHLTWEKARLVGHVQHSGYIVRVFSGWAFAGGSTMPSSDLWL